MLYLVPGACLLFIQQIPSEFMLVVIYLHDCNFGGKLHEFAKQNVKYSSLRARSMVTLTSELYSMLNNG